LKYFENNIFLYSGKIGSGTLAASNIRSRKIGNIMGPHVSVNTCSLESFEGLHQAIKGSHVEVMQLGRGKFSGSLSHVGIGDFSLSIGSFSVGVPTQRISTDDKLVVGMLLNSEDRVTHFSFDMRPADVLIM